MSISKSRNSPPHYERGSVAVLQALTSRNPYLSLTNPYYHPLKQAVGSGRGAGAWSESDPRVEATFGNIYKSSYASQAGRGVGSLISKLGRFVRPLAARGVEAILDEGRRTGKDILHDLSMGADTPKRVVKRGLKEAGKRLVQRLPRIILGSGKKKKGKRQAAPATNRAGRAVVRRALVLGRGKNGARVRGACKCGTARVGSGRRKKRGKAHLKKKGNSLACGNHRDIFS